MQISINISGELATCADVDAFLAKLRHLFSATATAAYPGEKQAAAEVIAVKAPEGLPKAVVETPSTATAVDDVQSVPPSGNIVGEPSGTAKRKRRSAAEMEAARQAAAEVAAPSVRVETVTVQATPATASNVTQDDVRAAVNALLETDGGEPILIAALSAYGAKGVKDLKPEHYGAVVAKLRDNAPKASKPDFANYM